MSICEDFHPLHTPEFQAVITCPAAHEAIAQGARLIAALVYRTLTDGDFRQALRTSWQGARKRKLEG